MGAPSPGHGAQRPGGTMSALASSPWVSTLQTRWRELAARERRLAVVGAAVVVLGLTWALALQPAWRTVVRAGAEHAALDAQLQQMQRLAAEVQELRAAPAVTADEAEAALKTATERLGDQGKLILKGGRAVLSVNGVGTSALRDWLAEARAGARARPLEANLTRAANGYNGTLVLAVGGAQ